MIRRDNGSIHTSRTTEEDIRQHDMIRVHHPPYSGDFASSDLDLLPTIKEKTKDVQMAGDKDLFYRLQEILNSIAPKNWTRSLAQGSTGSSL
jgi:hypothetical protein